MLQLVRKKHRHQHPKPQCVLCLCLFMRRKVKPHTHESTTSPQQLLRLKGSCLFSFEVTSVCFIFLCRPAWSDLPGPQHRHWVVREQELILEAVDFCRTQQFSDESNKSAEEFSGYLSHLGGLGVQEAVLNFCKHLSCVTSSDQISRLTLYADKPVHHWNQQTQCV